MLTLLLASSTGCWSGTSTEPAPLRRSRAAAPTTLRLLAGWEPGWRYLGSRAATADPASGADAVLPYAFDEQLVSPQGLVLVNRTGELAVTYIGVHGPHTSFKYSQPATLRAAAELKLTDTHDPMYGVDVYYRSAKQATEVELWARHGQAERPPAIPSRLFDGDVTSASGTTRQHIELHGERVFQKFLVSGSCVDVRSASIRLETGEQLVVRAPAAGARRQSLNWSGWAFALVGSRAPIASVDLDYALRARCEQGRLRLIAR